MRSKSSRNSDNANTRTGRNARLANLMSEAGLTGAELARRIDVDKSTVSAWRTGARPVHGAAIAYLELLVAVLRAARGN